MFQVANGAEHFDLFSLLSFRRLRPSLRASLLPLSSSPFNVRIVGSQWFSIAKVGPTFSSELRDSGFGLCGGRKWTDWPDDESPGRCYRRPPLTLMGYCNPKCLHFQSDWQFLWGWTSQSESSRSFFLFWRILPPCGSETKKKKKNKAVLKLIEQQKEFWNFMKVWCLHRSRRIVPGCRVIESGIKGRMSERLEPESVPPCD